MLISQLIQQTLEAASTKTASVMPRQTSAPDIVDLVFPQGETTPQVEAAPAKTASVEENFPEMAAHGMKIARALGIAADIVQKVAQNPEVTATPIPGPRHDPKASTTSIPASLEVGGSKLDGHALETTPSKQASLRLINAKIADAEVLARYGQKAAAHQLRQEALELKQASMDDGPRASGNPALPTMAAGEGGAGGPNLSNDRLIGITRAEARNPTTAEVRKVIKERPKVDPATAAAVGSAEGVKASAAEFLREYIKKAKLVLQDPAAPEGERQKAAAVVSSMLR